MSIKTIEIKAQVEDLNRIKAELQTLKAIYNGVDRQIDIYFKSKVGHLKLRESRNQAALIYYNRPKIKGPKKSEVLVYNTKIDSNLRLILEKALEVIVIVEKERQIFSIDNIRFHLDAVRNLGSFLEIEADNSSGNFSDDDLKKQVRLYLEQFGVKPNQLQPGSYSDLILKREKNYKSELN